MRACAYLLYASKCMGTSWWLTSPWSVFVNVIQCDLANWKQLSMTGELGQVITARIYQSSPQKMLQNNSLINIKAMHLCVGYSLQYNCLILNADTCLIVFDRVTYLFVPNWWWISSEFGVWYSDSSFDTVWRSWTAIMAYDMELLLI